MNATAAKSNRAAGVLAASGGGCADPGAPSFSAAVFGLASSLCARFVFGMDWAPSILLFMPTKGLTGQIVSNSGYGILRHFLTLLFFPLVVVLSPRVAAIVLDAVPKAARARMSPLFEAFIGFAGSFAIFVAVFLVASFAASMYGDFALPRRVHDALSRTVEVLSRILFFAFAVVAVRFADERLLHMPSVVKAAVFVALCAGLTISIFQVARRKPAQGKDAAKDAAQRGDARTQALRLAARPDVRLDDVIGMDEAKEQVRFRLIEPVRNPALAKLYGIKPGGGMLLYGPPGTGKTMLARAVAGELRLPFFMLTASDVFGKFVGESERNIRRIFAEIRSNPLSVVFVDEMESIFPARTDDLHETTRKVISLILQELDGLDTERNPMLLIGATNVPWMVDGAFLRPGRFDVKIYVGLPDEDARRQMLRAAFDKGGIPPDAGLVEYIAARTQNFSGADLNGVMDRIRQLAYAARARRYSAALAERALATVRPTADAAMLERLHKWGGEAN